MLSFCLLVNLLIGVSMGFKPDLFSKMNLVHSNSLEPLKNLHLFQENLNTIIDVTGKEIGYNVVKSISSILPHVDSIGHKILHADNELIVYIINMDKIPHELKAYIILLSIKFAQYGDHFGSHMLQLYYNIVEKCLL